MMYRNIFRYNLKRKASDLAPVSAEEFQNRVHQARNEEELSQQDQSTYCLACKKFFKTKNAHDNHLNSKRHKELLKLFLENHVNQDDDKEIRISVPSAEIIEERQQQQENEDDDMDAESVDSEEWEANFDLENPISKSNCIFCDHHSKNLVKNLKHMSIAHSFFIPDAEFCCDVEGLLSYLAEKVCRDFICLWCNEKGRTFYSIQGNLIVLLIFVNLTESFLGVRQHMIEKGHTKMLHEGACLAEYEEFYDYSASYPDHESDTVDPDAEIEQTVLDGDEYQLVLPSGNVIGHRSLMRYYKQRINPNRAVVLKKSNKKLHHVLAQYRALGWSEDREAVARKVRDIHSMKRVQSKLYMRLGAKANKFQTHYRPQVNF